MKVQTNRLSKDSKPQNSSEQASSPRRFSQKLPTKAKQFVRRRDSLKSKPNKSSMAHFLRKGTVKGVFCTICQQDFDQSELTSINNCKHLCCKECLNRYSVYKINLMEEVTCPRDECEAKLDPQGPIFKRLPDGAKEKYKMNQLWKQTVNNPNLKLCPTEGCHTVINTKEDSFQCPKCNIKFCQECLLPQHKGPCQDNFQEHFKDWKRCPNCLMFIQKKQGGNHMICTCSYHFCYICQGTWSDVHHHCQPKEEREKGGCRKGMTNCLLDTLLRQLEKIHIYSYKIRDWSRCRQISVGIFMAMVFFLFVVLLIPLLIFDVIFIVIVSFFCGTFIVYGDQMCWYHYLLWPFISIIGLIVGFYVGLHYQLELMSGLINDYWRIIAVCICDYEVPTQIYDVPDQKDHEFGEI